MQFRIRRLAFHFGWLLVLNFFYATSEPLKFEIKGDSAILMNAQTGVILFDYQGFTPQYPASTTKIATALFALKLHGGDLDMPIAAEQDSLEVITEEAKRKANDAYPPYRLELDGSHIGIRQGEILSLKTLLQGMLISSGDDAANVIAQALGPSVPVFMDKLNAYLQDIGCKQTYFQNPHGLRAPQHQSTAYDLALMTREALKDRVFCEIVSQSRFLRPKTNKQAATTLLQTNRLIRPGQFHYAKAIGVKTGFHVKAKNAFVGAAQANGRTFIVVLMGYQDRNSIFEDATKLFEAAFNQPKVQRLFFQEGAQVFTKDLARANIPLRTYLSAPVSLEYYPAEDPQPKCLLIWQPLALPIHKDQPVAELQLVSLKGDVLKQVPLLAAEEVRLAWPYDWLAWLSAHFWLLILCVGMIPVIIFLKTRNSIH